MQNPIKLVLPQSFPGNDVLHIRCTRNVTTKGQVLWISNGELEKERRSVNLQ